MNILSLGAGVQSSTVLLMSCRGILPRLDGAIFADVGWEPPAVYAYINAVLKPEAEKAGIPIHVCSKGDLRADALRSTIRSYDAESGGRWASMPLYTKGTGSQGTEGQLRRQCTKEYKITPVHQKLRLLLNGREKKAALWFGISADEKRRMRFSQVGWIEHVYPLIFELDRPYHRVDCLRWMEQAGFPMPPRSACIGCPYHSDAEWRAIKHQPDLWLDAVEFDAAIRLQGMTGSAIHSEVYLHRSCKPLPMIDFESLEDKGQQNWINECEGMCGV